MEHHHLTPNDWSAVAEDPRFRAYLASKRRFIVPATIFFLAYYLALPVTAGFWPEVMGRPLWGPLTVAFAFALSQFLMTFVLLALFVGRARAFDAMEERVVDIVRKDLA